MYLIQRPLLVCDRIAWKGRSIDETTDKLEELTLDDPVTQPEHGSTLAPQQSSSKHTSKRKKHRNPNFRDFPAGEDPLLPRQFTTNALGSNMSMESSMGGVNTLFTVGPAGEPVEYSPEDLRSPPSNDQTYDPRHPPQLSEVVVEAFEDVTTPSMLDPTLAQDPSDSSSFFSQTGIVHLGPVDSPSSVRSHSLGSSRGRTSRASGCNLDAADRDVDVVQLPSTARDAVVSESGSESASASGSASVSASGNSTSASSEGPHITFRYQHMEDEEGHHLIVGREGKLTRCEDEVSKPSFIRHGF
jgi:hypothetical protein